MNKQTKKMRRFINKQIKKETKATLGYYTLLPFRDRLRVAIKILRGRHEKPSRTHRRLALSGLLKALSGKR